MMRGGVVRTLWTALAKKGMSDDSAEERGEDEEIARNGFHY